MLSACVVLGWGVVFAQSTLPAQRPKKGVDALGQTCADRSARAKKEICGKMPATNEKERALQRQCEKAQERDALEYHLVGNPTGTKEKGKRQSLGGYCEREEKIKERLGVACGACAKGVSVVSRPYADGIKAKACKEENGAETAGGKKQGSFRAFCREVYEDALKKDEEMKAKDIADRKAKKGTALGTPNVPRAVAEKMLGTGGDAHKKEVLETGAGREFCYTWYKKTFCDRGHTIEDAKKLVGNEYDVRATYYPKILSSSEKTVSGDEHDNNGMTAAHPTLPMGTIVEVCADRCADVRINDRGPYGYSPTDGMRRGLDLTPGAMRAISDSGTRTGEVSVRMTIRSVPDLEVTQWGSTRDGRKSWVQVFKKK